MQTTVVDFLLEMFQTEEGEPLGRNELAADMVAAVQRFAEQCDVVGQTEDGEPLYRPEDLADCFARFDDEWAKTYGVSDTRVNG